MYVKQKNSDWGVCQLLVDEYWLTKWPKHWPMRQWCRILHLYPNWITFVQFSTCKPHVILFVFLSAVILLCAQMLGLAEGCFNTTVPYLHERKQFGQTIWNFQVRIASNQVVQKSYFRTKSFAIFSCVITAVTLSVVTPL